MKLTATREQIGALSPIHFGTETMTKIGTVIAGGVLDNVKHQKQADGSPLKVNAPATIERKLKDGQRPMSLVDDGHRLVQGRGGSYVVTATSNSVSVEPSAVAMPGKRMGRAVSPAQLVGWLEAKGYTGWVGVSARARAAIAAILRMEFKAAALRNAAKRIKTVRS